MKSVLLVDDEPELLEILEYVFKQLNFRVISFADIVALETIKEITPNLIVLDLNIGQKSAGHLCKELKINQDTQNIPVLILSADENIAAIAKDNLADAHLRKPFDLASLRNAVKKISV